LARPASAADSVVYASSFGYNATDATAALQAALDDTDADTVVVDNVGSDWIVDPLFINRSDVTVIFEAGVVVRAKTGYGPNDSLITGRQQHDVTLIGYGATLTMNKAEYTSGEFRMALRFYSMTNLTVEGLNVLGSGGDGIYLGDAGGAQNYNSNVLIKDIWLDGHRRNGLSVISVDGLTLDNVRITNTNGTAPQLGIDFEPNNATERLAHMTMKDVDLDGNVGGCLMLTESKLSQDSPDVGLNVDGLTCLSTGSRYGAITIYGSSQDQVGPAGSISFRDATVIPHGHSGCFAIYRKPAAGTALSFVDSSCIDLGNSFTTDPYPQYPVTIHGSSLTVPYGGADFDNVRVITDLDEPIVGVIDSANQAGVAHLTGAIGVIDPHGVSVDLGTNPHDNTLTVTSLLR
jgi:hypothetical protein